MLTIATATHSVDIVLQGDRVPLLKGHRQALERKHCFPVIFDNDGAVSANLLNQFNTYTV